MHGARSAAALEQQRLAHPGSEALQMVELWGNIEVTPANIHLCRQLKVSWHVHGNDGLL